MTSNNRQQRHCQFWLAWLKIKAITDCNGHNQHHHCEAPKRSQDKRPSNATRRAVAISLGATRWPCPQTWQRCRENVVSIMTILIPQQQSLSKERHLPWCKRDKHNQEPAGPLNGKPKADWAYSCLRSPVTRTSRSTTKHVVNNLKKTIKNTATWHLHHVSHARHLFNKQHRQWDDIIPSNNKTSASWDDNNEDKNYHLHFHKN